jgi:ABC-type nitrate/sulfonate/bicarbonate transport system ATPase subunit
MTALLDVSVERKAFRRGGVDQIVLTDVVLTVKPAEIVAVYGRSGCGKSTVLRIAAALDRDFIGSVTLANREVTQPTQDIGMTVQGDATFGWLSVRQNILWPRHFAQIRSETAEGHADPNRLAELVGLSQRDLSKYPHEISAGMKQRVVLARALAAQPKVLLLDEPFSSLDYEARAELQELVLTIRASAHVAFVCVTHDPEEALYLADRVIVLGGQPATVVETLPGVTDARDLGLRTSRTFHERMSHLRSLLKRHDQGN